MAIVSCSPDAIPARHPHTTEMTKLILYRRPASEVSSARKDLICVRIFYICHNLDSLKNIHEEKNSKKNIFNLSWYFSYRLQKKYHMRFTCNLCIWLGGPGNNKHCEVLVSCSGQKIQSDSKRFIP